jgi:hypothetical protein
LVSNTLSFSRFNPSKLSNEKANVALLGYDYVLTNVSSSGTVTLANIGGSTINGPFNVQSVLNFDRLDANSSVAFNPVAASASGSLPPASSGSFPLTGTATGLVTPDPFIPLATPADYTNPPSTPLPSLTSYSASWAYISPPGPLSGFTGSTVSGRIAVRWHYSYDYLPVPGPLPLLGAGVGFAFSRNLRRRIRGLA